MERKQNKDTEKIMIKVAQTIIIIFMDIAWLTDYFCSRFLPQICSKRLLPENN